MQEAVGGLAYVRDGIDIIPFICGHYLRLGFSRLIFLDDKSVDGTYEFLEALSRRDPRVSVQHVDIPDVLYGMEVKNAVVNAMIADGVGILFPFDQDEFWNIDLASVRAASRPASSGVFSGLLVQFLQDTRVQESRFLNVLRSRHRAPALEYSSTRAAKIGKPYLCYTKQKVGVKAEGPVSFGQGNHRMDEGPENYLGVYLEVFHLPLRSKDEIRKRVNQERFHHKYLEGKHSPDIWAGIWAASSADADGCLTSEGGEIFMLVPDTRLRRVLIRALIYMVLHHPLLLMRAAWYTRRAYRVRATTPAPGPGPVPVPVSEPPADNHALSSEG